jgi:hypothetical protein
MFLNSRKRNSKPKSYKSSEVTIKNCILKTKPMSPMAKLMAIFYGVDSKQLGCKIQQII